MIRFDPGDGGLIAELDDEQAFQTAVSIQQQGQLERAAALYRALADAHPHHPEVLRLWGVCLLQQGQIKAAVDKLERVVEMAPRSAAAWCNLGSARRAGGQIRPAKDAFGKALALDPMLAEAHNNLGSLALSEGRSQEAISQYRRAVELAPGAAMTHTNLAAALLGAGAAADALSAAKQAVSCDSRSLPARRIHAMALGAVGQTSAACTELEQLRQQGMDDAELNHQLGVLLDALGRWDEALAAQHRALAHSADHGAALSEVLFLQRRLCRWEGLDALWARCRKALHAGTPGIKPFTLLSEWSTAAEQQRAARLWAQRFERGTVAAQAPQAAGLTVGYLSSGFHRHPTACLTAELFERHSRQGFRWIGYSVGPDDGSELRQRIAAGMDLFRDLRGASHAAMAEQIHADGVDVLVDLRGYGGGAVTEVLALRPAPIQVNWLAYPGTMGAEFIDYIIIDRHIASAEVLAHLDETPVILPHSYQPCDTTRKPSLRPLSHSDCGLPDDAFVYACFNNSYKFSAAVFDRWMNILRAVPGSVLWLLAGARGSSMPDNLRREAAARGVEADRLVFSPKLPHLEYLARYRLADLFLDTLPYNAHTTAGDALWAGCPVLTCRGDSFAGRVAASLCHSAGLAELVVDDLEAYQDLAIRLAEDPGRLRSLRERLNSDKDQRPLFQTRRLAGELERAYRRMAEHARSGSKPERIEI